MNARTSGIVCALLLLGIGLAGCAAPTQNTPGTAPPPATAGPAQGSATTTTFGSGESLVYDCSQLVDSQTLAQLDPGLKPDAETIPDGASALEALAIKGTACSWSDPDSQTTLIATAAKPDAATFATLKATASKLTPDPEFGTFVSAYTDGTELQLFTVDGAWATANSALFADPAKLTLIGQVLLEQLPAG